jgi:SnoaL-like polyketide cyclase
VVDRDQLVDFARRYTAAWCSGEPEQVAEHYSPMGSLTINDGEPAIGRAAIADAARSFMSAFPDLQVLMDDLHTDGHGVEYHWTLIGTNTGSCGTGNAVRISGFEEWAIGEDGLIAKSLGQYDQAEYDRQIADGADPE